MSMDDVKRLSAEIDALTGAGPAFLYSTAPTPGSVRLVLSDGVKYTEGQALARLTVMLADAKAGRGSFYCRVCRDAGQYTRKERDVHEAARHTVAQLKAVGVFAE